MLLDLIYLKETTTRCSNPRAWSVSHNHIILFSSTLQHLEPLLQSRKYSPHLAHSPILMDSQVNPNRANAVIAHGTIMGLAFGALFPLGAILVRTSSFRRLGTYSPEQNAFYLTARLQPHFHLALPGKQDLTAFSTVSSVLIHCLKRKLR